MSGGIDVAFLPLEVGVRIKFAGDAKWWAVRAESADRRYAVCTRQAEFKPKGEVFYTIVDQVEYLRGPCNLIGQSWDAYMSDEKCAELIAALESGEVEISHRNRVGLNVSG